jgi:hypothetical protein
MSKRNALTGWRISEFKPSDRRTDENLIKEIATGNQAAMRTLYSRHHIRVYHFLARLLSDAGSAEDIVSEVFLGVWRQAGTFDLDSVDRAIQGSHGARSTPGRPIS